jgi:hypothetical protein
MKQEPIIHDERFYAVENASYRIGYLILAFGTMGLIIIRSILYQQSNWDFFALVIISSFAATIYQLRHKILPYTSKSFYLMFVLILVVSVVAAAAVVLLKTLLIK